MPDEPYVTRRELDFLKAASDADHAKIWQRIESMDDHGTRGVQGLTVRMDNLISDVADLKTEVKTDVGVLRAEVATRFAAHQKVHDEDAADRRDSRRWRIMAVIGAGATMIAMLSLLIEIAAKMH